MLVFRKQFSKDKDEEKRIKKMKAKLVLDDIGTITGIHPLYRKAKEKITGKKTLYHYTSGENLDSIKKHGFDPNKDQAFEKFKKIHNDKDFDSGVYFGNGSKSVPRSTAIDRNKSLKRKIKRGEEPEEEFGNPGVMMTLKIPIKEYKKMRKRESDPMVDKYKVNFKNLMRSNKRFREDYKNSNLLEKTRIRLMANNLQNHLEKDVTLMQEKVDPKYITKIDKDWS